MKKLASSLILIGAAATLGACSGGALGPDEFQVVERPRLVVPPESELRPPRPGKPQARNIDPGRIAFETLFPGAKFPGRDPKSDIELSLISKLGRTEPDIRTNVGRTNLPVVKKALILTELLDGESFEHAPDNASIERVSSTEKADN